MKSLLRDGVALLGLGCVASGLYLEFDLGIALLVMGALLLVATTLSMRGR